MTLMQWHTHQARVSNLLNEFMIFSGFQFQEIIIIYFLAITIKADLFIDASVCQISEHRSI